MKPQSSTPVTHSLPQATPSHPSQTIRQWGTKLQLWFYSDHSQPSHYSRQAFSQLSSSPRPLEQIFNTRASGHSSSRHESGLHSPLPASTLSTPCEGKLGSMCKQRRLETWLLGQYMPRNRYQSQSAVYMVPKCDLQGCVSAPKVRHLLSSHEQGLVDSSLSIHPPCSH